MRQNFFADNEARPDPRTRRAQHQGSRETPAVRLQFMGAIEVLLPRFGNRRIVIHDVFVRQLASGAT